MFSLYIPYENQKLLSKKPHGNKSPEAREKARKNSIKQFSDPEQREKARQASKKRFEDPKEIEKILATRKANFVSKIPTLEQMIIELGEIPYCQCNCGNKVKVNLKLFYLYKKNGYPKFLKGHQGIGRHINVGIDHPMFGTQWTDERKQQHSIRMSGENHPLFGTHPEAWNKGIPMSEEVKKKDSESHMGQTPWNKGLKCPQLSGENNPMYGKQTPHGKKIYLHSTPFQGEILMHNWDELYATYLDENNIKYYYEPQAFPLILNNKNTTYRPDFYLPEQNLYIEIKGYWRDDSLPKFLKFKETYPEIKIELLFSKELKDLEIKLRRYKQIKTN